jgi:hypothetical protein
MRRLSYLFMAILLLTACGESKQDRFERRVRERKERIRIARENGDEGSDWTRNMERHLQKNQKDRLLENLPPPQEQLVFEAVEIMLDLPADVDPIHYRRVRAHPILGPALDKQLLDALGSDNPARYRLADFEAKRKDAVRDFAKAMKSPTAVPGSPMSEELEVIDDFDKVCTDALFRWFELYVSASQRRENRSDAYEELRELEGRALYAFPWDPNKGKEARALVTKAIIELQVMDAEDVGKQQQPLPAREPATTRP